VDFEGSASFRFFFFAMTAALITLLATVAVVVWVLYRFNKSTKKRD
jgi:hypothetical protein